MTSQCKTTDSQLFNVSQRTHKKGKSTKLALISRPAERSNVTESPTLQLHEIKAYPIFLLSRGDQTHWVISPTFLPSTKISSQWNESGSATSPSRTKPSWCRFGPSALICLRALMPTTSSATSRSIYFPFGTY